MFQPLIQPVFGYRKYPIDLDAAPHTTGFLRDFPEISRFLVQTTDSGMPPAKRDVSDNAPMP
jgi:hypothetical protein